MGEGGGGGGVDSDEEWRLKKGLEGFRKKGGRRWEEERSSVSDQNRPPLRTDSMTSATCLYKSDSKTPFFCRFSFFFLPSFLSFFPASSLLSFFLFSPQLVYDCQMALYQMLDEWRSTVVVPGTLCVTTISTNRRRKLSVNSLGTTGEFASFL